MASNRDSLEKLMFLLEKLKSNENSVGSIWSRDNAAKGNREGSRETLPTLSLRLTSPTFGFARLQFNCIVQEF